LWVWSLFKLCQQFEILITGPKAEKAVGPAARRMAFSAIRRVIETFYIRLSKDVLLK
jgi:hypothetical protein